jgi:N-methylhydantoinase A/acetophenone carboxylase
MIINVDTGGTHTDVFLVDHETGAQATGKASTTDYDLSVGFMDAIETAAAEWDMSLQEALDEAEMIKYSTTTGVNAIIERTGPRLGLITTRGFEDVMHTGKSRNWADGLPREERLDFARAERPEMLIPHDRRVGVRERIDERGNVVMPLDEDDVREQVRTLVDKGVRGFVVNLLWSCENPVHERRVEEIIEEEYPDVYLGNMPVFLSSDISPKREEYTRLITTTLNAYMASTAEEHVLDLTDKLRARDYDDPIFAVRNTGGVASLSRTAPLHLFEAGPIAGVLGSEFIGSLYGEENVLATDMGGTSFDLGISMEHKERNYEFHPVVDRWRIQLPIVETTSIGAGGGSIAWVDDVDQLQVGPQSAGADPGPACYNQGGTRPTVTDADLVLGYLNPDYFLGGRQSLSVRRAERAIKRHVARPLDIGVEEAAFRIRRLIDGRMGQEIHKQTALKGYDPREFVMFSFGGAGPVHVCDCAEYVDVSKIVTFPFGSVFNAFGAGTMDVVHRYTASVNERAAAVDPGADRYAELVAELEDQAVRDIRGEGLDPGRIESAIALVANHPDGERRLLAASSSLPAALEHAGDAYVEATRPSLDAADVVVEALQLRAIVPLPNPEHPVSELRGPDASHARKAERPVHWDTTPTTTPVYEYGALEPGNRVSGPAVVESVDTTYAIPAGWTFAVNAYRHGVLVADERDAATIPGFDPEPRATADSRGGDR